MPPIAKLLLLTLVSQCWSAPQRRNWTPQAILYLKGAQGHRSVLERASREEGDILRLMSHDQDSDGLRLSLSSVLLELLQRAEKESAAKEANSLNAKQLDVNYW